MQFHPYKGLMWSIKQGEKDSPYIAKKKDYSSMMIDLAALNFINAQRDVDGRCSDQNYQTSINEFLHYFLMHHVINIATPIAERLLHTNIELKLDALNIPFRVFEICFDQDFKILGKKAESCLVLINPDKPIISAMEGFNEVVFKRINDYLFKSGRKPLTIAENSIDSNFKQSLEIKYRDPFSPIDNLIPCMCHLNLNTERDKNKSAEEIIDGLPKLQHTSNLIEFNDEERDYQKQMLRLVLGLLCYMNTNNPDVQKWKNRNRGKFGHIPADELLIGSKMERMPPSWHLRKAHFRTLAHERFKRDESGVARVIWVKAAEIKGSVISEKDAKEDLINS